MLADPLDHRRRATQVDGHVAVVEVLGLDEVVTKPLCTGELALSATQYSPGQAAQFVGEASSVSSSTTSSSVLTP